MTNTLAAITTGDTPPADTSALWLSTSLKDLRVSAARGDRRPVIIPSQSYEGSVAQEASVWYSGGYYHMIYSGNTGTVALCYARSRHPLTESWEKFGQVIGQGAGGWAGKAYHSSVYVEGSTLYCTFTDDTSFRLATADISAPTVWSHQGVILAPSATPLGNSVIIKDTTAPASERYKLWFDCSFNFTSWQDGYAVAASPAGPYTLAQLPITSMWPDAGAQAGGTSGQGGGGWFGREGNDWIQYFHAGPNVAGSVPTEMYRSTSTDLVNWTIDNNRQPILRRTDTGEGDQIADAFLVQSPTGQWFIFWEGYDNTASQATIYCAPMLPTLKRFDGYAWVPIQGGGDSSHGITDPGKSSVTTLTTDFSTASTTFVDMHTFYFRPTGTRCVVDVSGVGTNGTTSNQVFQVVLTGGATKPLGQINTPVASGQHGFGGKALFTGLTPDKLYTFKLQAKVGANTFYCRPASFPALEGCVAEVRDAAFPNPAP